MFTVFMCQHDSLDFKSDYIILQSSSSCVWLLVPVTVSEGFATPTSYTINANKDHKLDTLGSLLVFVVVMNVSEERMKGSC